MDLKKAVNFIDEMFQEEENRDYSFELSAIYEECQSMKTKPVMWFGDIGLPTWGFYKGCIWGVQPRNGNTSVIIDSKLNIIFEEPHRNMFAYSEEEFKKRIDEMV
ncbi:MAG: hypothetical protein PHX21_13800 [bacterium]|nr:hypothetical protein [bacterium]